MRKADESSRSVWVETLDKRSGGREQTDEVMAETELQSAPAVNQERPVVFG
jgi:hypothetical protein